MIKQILICMFLYISLQLIGTRDGFGLGTDPRLEGFPTYTMLHNEEMGKFMMMMMKRSTR